MQSDRSSAPAEWAQERDALASALRLCVEMMEQVQRDGLPKPDRIERGEDAAFGFWNTYQTRLAAGRAALSLPDIIARLSDACVGHPAARIPWPHRLLHEARDEIERLRSEVIRLRGVIEPTGSRGF